MADDISPEEALRDSANEYLELLRQKILYGLSIYKFLSPSQLHVFVGTATPTSLWKEQVLEKLIEQGLVISKVVTLTSPFDRSQTYTVLHLPENPYTPPEAFVATPETPCAPEESQTAAAA